jgi:ATP-binding cassette subfamily C protein
MRQLLAIFFRAEGTKPWIVIACLLIASLSEALGISTLLPTINTILGDSAAAPPGIGQSIKAFIASMGISPNLGNLLIIVITLLVMKSIIAFGALSYSGITGARVAINLRRRLIKAIFEARWSFYSDESGGRFANAVSNDATRAGDAYQFAAVVMAGILQLMTFSIVALLIDWRSSEDRSRPITPTASDASGTWTVGPV